MCIVWLKDSLGYNSENFIMDKANKIYQKHFKSIFGSVLVAARDIYVCEAVAVAP